MAAAAAEVEDTKGVNSGVSDAAVEPLSEFITTEGQDVPAAAPATGDQTDQRENHNVDGGLGEEMGPERGEGESEYSAGGGNEDGGKPPAPSARGSTAASGGGGGGPGRKRERKKKGNKGVGGGRGGVHAGNPALSVEDLFVTISTVQVCDGGVCVCVSGVFPWVFML